MTSCSSPLGRIVDAGAAVVHLLDPHLDLDVADLHRVHEDLVAQIAGEDCGPGAFIRGVDPCPHLVSGAVAGDGEIVAQVAAAVHDRDSRQANRRAPAVDGGTRTAQVDGIEEEVGIVAGEFLVGVVNDLDSALTMMSGSSPRLSFSKKSLSITHLILCIGGVSGPNQLGGNVSGVVGFKPNRVGVGWHYERDAVVAVVRVESYFRL